MDLMFRVSGKATLFLRGSLGVGACPVSYTHLDVYKRQFENREEAVAWICRNQLGRRNLSPEQKRYLLGKQYEAEKKLSLIHIFVISVAGCAIYYQPVQKRKGPIPHSS